VRRETALEKYLSLLARLKASDLHIKVGGPPVVRVAGRLRAIEAPEFTPQIMEELVGNILNDEQKSDLGAVGSVDLAYSIPDVGRFRLSVFRQRGSTCISARRVNTEVPKFEELRLPARIGELAQNTSGLIILAGITGSGKSTTLAAMIEHVNRTQRRHVITIEDPIEYLFVDKKSVVVQREVGIDVDNFASALRSVVRQDPDVILIGEMRDRETLQAALQAAETGHLVMGTLHSTTVSQTFNRILDLFDPAQYEMTRTTISRNLLAIICQKLLRCIKPGIDLVPAVEILVATPIVRKLIHKGEFAKIDDVVHSSSEEGMIDFNRSLASLLKQELVDAETALAVSPSPDALKMALKGIDVGEKGIVA